MAFTMKTEKFYSSNNILSSEVGLVPKTRQLTQEMAVEEDGRKIIKAGTIFPANDATAEGVVLEDVDMTDDAVIPGAVAIAGRIIEDRLPVELAEEAKAKLIENGLHFDKEEKEDA